MNIIRALIIILVFCFIGYAIYDIVTFNDKEISGASYGILKNTLRENPSLVDKYNEAMSDGYISYTEYNSLYQYTYKKQLIDEIDTYE